MVTKKRNAANNKNNWGKVREDQIGRVAPQLSQSSLSLSREKGLQRWQLFSKVGLRDSSASPVYLYACTYDPNTWLCEGE